VVALAALLVLGLALAGDGEDVVLDLDRHVVLGQTRKVRAQDVVVVGLDEVHRRQPAAARALAGAYGCVEEGVEEPVDLSLDRVELAHRLPAYECHLRYLL